MQSGEMEKSIPSGRTPSRLWTPAGTCPGQRLRQLFATPNDIAVGNLPTVKPTSLPCLTPRTGGQILVRQLITHGVQQLFCVPGELPGRSDALHDADIAVTVCRQEGGAAMMAEAQASLTGRPGICSATRGRGDQCLGRRASPTRTPRP